MPLAIMFWMNSYYFYEEIINSIEKFGCKYLIKGKIYSIVASQVTASSILLIKSENVYTIKLSANY